MTDIVERLRAYDNNGTASWLVLSKAADEIERLEKENESLKASVYGLYELEKELYECQAREDMLREALECYFKQYPHMMKGYILDALALPQDDTALKEYRKRVLLEAANAFEDGAFETPWGLRRMAEES